MKKLKITLTMIALGLFASPLQAASGGGFHGQGALDWKNIPGEAVAFWARYLTLPGLVTSAFTGDIATKIYEEMTAFLVGNGKNKEAVREFWKNNKEAINALPDDMQTAIKNKVRRVLFGS